MENTKTDQTGKKKHILLSVLIGIAIFLIVVVIVCYGAVTNYYTTHFFKGTTINKIDCSNMTVDEVKEKLTEEVMSYALNIEERGDITERLLADDVGLTYVDDKSVDELFEKQKAYTWIKAVFSSHHENITAASSYNEDIIKESLKKLNCFQEGNFTSPKDAYVQEGESSYEIVPEEAGTELDFDKTAVAVIQAVEDHDKTINLDETGCYVAPDVLSDNKELVSYTEKVNKYLNAKLTYDFGGDDRQVVVDGSVIKDWLKKGDNGLAKTGDNGYPIIDESKVKSFVKTEMAKKYDTLGKPHKFKTHAGKTITLKNGFYGWRMNQDKTAEAMIKAIKKGKQKEMEVSYRYTAASRAANDIGDTYVEVDIKHQKMYCYENGKLKVETDVVTGKPVKGRRTPSNGIWSIIYKKRDADLGTINDLGYSSHVSYWMPFNGNVGIHDADGWRTEYGGKIYKTNGSHGCVNTPLKACKKIYKIVSKGTPVIVYGK